SGAAVVVRLRVVRGGCIGCGADAVEFVCIFRLGVAGGYLEQRRRELFAREFEHLLRHRGSWAAWLVDGRGNEQRETEFRGADRLGANVVFAARLLGPTVRLVLLGVSLALKGVLKIDVP